MNIIKRSCWLLLAAVLAGCRSPQTPPSIKTPTPPVSAAAAIPHPRLTISLDHSFPEYGPDGTPIRANFQTLAQDVLQVVQSRFGGRNPFDTRPIVCYVSTEAVPRTDVFQDPAVTWVGLVLTPDRIQKLDYSQFAYQLAHELGHIMMGARRSNGLIESLADATSYQALTDLSELWPQKYSNLPGWRDYAYNFQNYRAEIERGWLSHFPQEVQHNVTQGHWSQVAQYLKQQQANLDKEPYTDNGLAIRSINTMVLLSQPVCWQDFVDLTNYTNPSPQQDTQYRNDLPIDLSRAPVSVQESVGRIR